MLLFLGGSFSHLNHVIREATEVLSSFKQLTSTPEDGIEQISVHLPMVWQVPPLGCYKVNWDAVYGLKTRLNGFWGNY
jgi:hypothetical protein